VLSLLDKVPHDVFVNDYIDKFHHLHYKEQNNQILNKTKKIERKITVLIEIENKLDNEYLIGKNVRPKRIRSHTKTCIKISSNFFN